jgi:hypothetical protein
MVRSSENCMAPKRLICDKDDEDLHRPSVRGTGGRSSFFTAGLAEIAVPLFIVCSLEIRESCNDL